MEIFGHRKVNSNLIDFPLIEFCIEGLVCFTIALKILIWVLVLNDLLIVENINADEWMDIQFELQPTIYKLKEGDTLRLVLYTTDFEITIRDNTAYHLTVDLEQSTLILPCQRV